MRRILKSSSTVRTRRRRQHPTPRREYAIALVHERHHLPNWDVLEKVKSSNHPYGKLSTEDVPQEILWDSRVKVIRSENVEGNVGALKREH